MLLKHALQNVKSWRVSEPYLFILRHGGFDRSVYLRCFYMTAAVTRQILKFVLCLFEKTLRDYTNTRLHTSTVAHHLAPCCFWGNYTVWVMVKCQHNLWQIGQEEYDRSVGIFTHMGLLVVPFRAVYKCPWVGLDRSSQKMYRCWNCLTDGPDHQDGGGTGPLLSSHRWDVWRHILGPAVERESERGGERERRILFPLMKASFQL